LRSYAVSTYYKYQKKVRDAIEERLAQVEVEPVFLELPVAKQTILPPASVAIQINYGELKIEIYDGISKETIAGLIEALKC